MALSNEAMAKVFRGAVKTLKTSGWTKDQYVNENNCTCMMGAVMANMPNCDLDKLGKHNIVIEPTNYEQLNKELCRDIREHHPEFRGCSNVPDFNDDEDTTYEDVIDTFNRTIRRLEDAS